MAFTREMATAAPRLRLVQVPGAGLDRVDRGALGPETALANAYGHDVGIAEYVIGAMLAITRSFNRIDAHLRQGRWDSVWAGAPVPLWPELAGKTLAVLGYGRIGQAVARRALAFDMDVRAIRRDAGRPRARRGHYAMRRLARGGSAAAASSSWRGVAPAARAMPTIDRRDTTDSGRFTVTSSVEAKRSGTYCSEVLSPSAPCCIASATSCFIRSSSAGDLQTIMRAHDRDLSHRPPLGRPRWRSSDPRSPGQAPAAR